jgi:hypothetical protein
MVSVAVFVIDPVPSMLVPAPLRVIAPVPLSVPFTTRFPETPSVKVEVANTPDALIVTPVMVLLAGKVTVCPAAMTTLSVAAGTTPPTHVDVTVQLPVCAEVIVAAVARVPDSEEKRSTRAEAPTKSNM